MILVTGGAGFIGANFVLDWLRTSDEPVVKLDALTYAGNLENLASLKACGKWLKNNPIPEIESSWGIANLVVDQNYKRLREICERAAGKNANRSPQEKRIGDFWKEAMDSAKCNSLGMAPIVPELAKIDSIKSKEELLEHMALYQSYAIGAGFDIYIGRDDKNSSRMRLYLVQGGIGLPNRDYYFNKDARTTGLRDVYKKHIAQQLSNINISNADKISESIYLLEEKFAGRRGWLFE